MKKSEVMRKALGFLALDEEYEYAWQKYICLCIDEVGYRSNNVHRDVYSFLKDDVIAYLNNGEGDECECVEDWLIAKMGLRDEAELLERMTRSNIQLVRKTIMEEMIAHYEEIGA